MAPTLVRPWSWPHPERERERALNEKTRTNMFTMVHNFNRALWKYIRHLDSCDITDNSDSSDSRQKQTCLQDFETVCISKRIF